MQKGKASIAFDHPPLICGAASVAGSKEGEGPLGQLFDLVEQDDRLGKKNWEASRKLWHFIKTEMEKVIR